MASVPLSIKTPDTTTTGIYRKYKYINNLSSKNQTGSQWSFEQCNDMDFKSKNNKKNYVQKNKKKLFNFKRDRLPSKEVSIYKQQQKLMSPTKLLQIKKQQQIKKMNTSISLKKSYHVDQYPIKSIKSIVKLDQFFINSTHKTKDINHTDKQISRIYSTSIHRKATQSSFMKRSQTAKKQAFIKVFGDDAYVSEKVVRPNKQPIFKNATKNRKKSKHLQEKQKKDRAQFSRLLGKLTDYSQIYNPLEKQIKTKKILTQQTNPQNQKDDYDKSEMVTWIKQITFDYTNKNIQMSDKFLSQQNNNFDINKVKYLNPKYFRQMKAHKQSRLKLRQKALIDTLKDRPNTAGLTNLNIQSWAQLQSRMKSDDNQQIIQNFSMLLTITDRGLQTVQPVRQNNMKRTDKDKSPVSIKIKNFIKNLMRALYNCKIFGIPKQNIYDVLWRERKPFQIQGSYTFFKYIKNGQVQIVQKFIRQNIQYIHQIDNHGRSPLLYAVLNAHSKVVSLILKYGVNVDQKGYNLKKPLYYALKNNDLQCTRLLLINGANPWSTKQCDYRDILEKDNVQINILMKNARKVHICIQLHSKKSERLNLWRKFRQEIREDSIINFS